MGYIAFNANTVTAQDAGAITGTSINVGSGAVTGGATTVTSLNAGSGAITTTGTLGAGATTIAGALTSYSLNIVNGGTGAISTVGTINGSTITASANYNTSGSAGYQIVGSTAISSTKAFSGSSLDITGAGAINTSTGTISTGGAINGGTISGSTSIQTPRSIIGSSNSSNNIIIIAKRVTGILAATTVYTITVSGSDSVDTFLELVAGGAASGVGNGARYEFFAISNPPPGVLSVSSKYTYPNGAVPPTFSFTGATTTTLPIRMSAASTWTGTIFVKLWNATGVASAGVWSIS